MLASKHARLDLVKGGWQLSPFAPASLRPGPRRGARGRGGGAAAGGALPRWYVASGSLLRVHGWDAGGGGYWSGTFEADLQPHDGGTAAQTTTLVAGLGECESVAVAGRIVRDGAGASLRAVVEFCLPTEACGLAWRATLVNEGGAVELDTITLMDGFAAPRPQRISAGPGESGSISGGPGPQGDGEPGLLELLTTLLAGALLLLIVAARGAISRLGLLVGLAALLCVGVVGAIVLDWARGRTGAWRWRSVYVSGWQSFSFAGFIPVWRCYGCLGYAWLWLWRAGLWWFNPTTLAPWILSGAFHDGARTPPVAWWGRWKIPKILRVPLWRSRAPVTSDMFALVSSQPDNVDGTVIGQGKMDLVIGMLSQHHQFTLVALDPWKSAVSMHASCDGCLLRSGARISTDWAVVHLQHGGDDDPLNPLAWYCDAVGRHCGARVSTGPAPTGWCSWYEHMERVSSEILVANADTMVAARSGSGPSLSVLQLDDGYAAHWGDWHTPNPARFPQGLQAASKAARDRNLTPGLWMAPFAADKDSKVAKEHPDWVLRRRCDLSWWPLFLFRSDVPANSGFTWPGKWFCGLDVTNPDCRTHVSTIVTAMVHEYGFTFLKMDFLHAAALPGHRHDPTVTRAQAMQIALRTIREACGDQVFLMGCSCPVGAAVGWVDALRISADTAESWDAWPVPWDKTNAPSARNAARNTVARQVLHRRWFLNNPDCLMVRDKHGSKLSLSEIQGCLTASAFSGGLLFLSDDLSTLAPKRLELASKLFPPVFQGCTAVCCSDEDGPELLLEEMSGPEGDWCLVALCNWTSLQDARAVSLEVLGLVPEGGQVVHALEFWEGHSSRGWAATLSAPSVGAHSASVFALRLRDEGQACYLGSDLHISCGKELTGWQSKDRSIEMQLDAKRVCKGKIWVFLPSYNTPSVSGSAFTGIAPEPAVRAGGGVLDGTWCVHVTLQPTGTLVVSW